MVERPQCHTHVTHTPAEEPTLFIDLHERRFYFRGGNIAVTVFVKYVKGSFCVGMSGKSRIEVGWNKPGPFTVFETVVDRLCESLAQMSLAQEPK